MKLAAIALPVTMLLSLCGCATQIGTLPAETNPPAAALSVMATQVHDQAALEKLRGNSGLTLQWISWDRRGTLDVIQRGPVVHLKGSQIAADGKGRLEIVGDILEIDAEHFTFVGRIEITDTPDSGRRCVKDGAVEFAITQSRKYWRMREFEWCDQLTDYIDIYF